MNKLFRVVIIAFVLFIFSNIKSVAQILDPVHWTFSVEQKSNSEAVLLLKAKMDGDWHIYAIDHKCDVGLPLVFTFNKADNNFTYEGDVIQPKAKEEFDETTKCTLKYFPVEAIFKQKIKIKADKPFKIAGTLNYQTCSDSYGGCLMPTDVEFSFNINKNSSKASTDTTTESTIDTVTIIPSTSAKTDTVTAKTATADMGSYTLSNDLSVLEPGCGKGDTKADDTSSLLGIFILAFFGGFIALLTPCVFPMIPMTVSFFTKRSGTKAKGIRNALIYATSIIVIYVALGLIITILFGSDALNALSSNSFFNLLFFFVFVIFALSFFGAFELVLPSSWVNKADQASDKGGLIGIFFMAFTLSLVSFSCTGPIIGTLLVQAAQGGYGGPAIGMFGFALALAIPFALFAAFPGWLSSLPKSGSWLNTVKVSLGFLELALALKFLSNVDLAYHWNFLKREIFISLWIIIFGLLGMYLLGKLKFAHDSDVPHIATGRLLFAIITFSFVIYLVPGMWGAPLNLISGFPPPEFYKEWKTSTTECPHDLNCFHDLDEGMAYARAQGKPVMIDFTGWNCVNCRRMEDKVWSQPKVLKKLREDYVLISLYVDDKESLSELKQFVSTYSNKKITTTGARWSDLEASIYNRNSQPYYVLIDHKGKLLAKPVGYTPSVDEYADYLDEGLCRFELRKKAD